MRAAMWVAMIAATTAVSSVAMAAPPTVAYQLASLDYGQQLRTTDARIRPYRIALSNLSTKCTETPRNLGDFTQRSYEILHNDGYRPPRRLAIMRYIKAAIPKALGRTRCQDIFAAWITLAEDHS